MPWAHTMPKETMMQYPTGSTKSVDETGATAYPRLSVDAGASCLSLTCMPTLGRGTFLHTFNLTTYKEIPMSFRTILSSLVAVCCIFIVWSASPASAVSTTLQTAHNVTGNQALSNVGVRFTVNSAISVFELGIYDSNLDGIAASSTAPLSAYLLTSAGGVVANITFDSTSQGTLDVASKYRFKPITLVTVLPGTYVLAGYGWNSNDLEHNCSISGICDTFDTGGGLITYLASPYSLGIDPAGTLPTTECCGNLNFWSAANMRFDDANTSVPEPTTFLLLSTGLIGMMGYSWQRRKKVA